MAPVTCVRCARHYETDKETSTLLFIYRKHIMAKNFSAVQENGCYVGGGGGGGGRDTV